MVIACTPCLIEMLWKKIVTPTQNNRKQIPQQSHQCHLNINIMEFFTYVMFEIENQDLLTHLFKFPEEIHATRYKNINIMKSMKEIYYFIKP